MKKESERQVQIRAEMTKLLFDITRQKEASSTSEGLPETTNTYGVMIILAASAFAVWYIGKPEEDQIVLLSLQAIALGCALIFASEFSLATRLSSFIKLLSRYLVK